MKPLAHPYRIIQTQEWRPGSPWRILKPSSAGRPYAPLVTDEGGAECLFRSYRDAVQYLIDRSLVIIGGTNA